MPHRTRVWIWAGRTTAVLAVVGLAVYMSVVGLDQAGKLAAPIGLVVALAALFAPYLLPAYQPPASLPTPSADTATSSPGVVIIADHNSVAAQHIGEVTMNVRSDPGGQAGL